MDPNANLQEQLQIAAALVALIPDKEDGHGLSSACYDAKRLAELVLALDEWINRGGFLPKQWQKPT